LCTDLADAPLAIAQQMGATHPINLSATPDALAAEAADKGQIDMVFECSGSPQALQAALQVVRPGGLIMLVGLGGDAHLPLNSLVAKEVRLHGSFRFDAEFGWAVDMINRRAIDVRPLLTATLPVDQAVEAFTLASDRSRSMKVQLAFS
jgi:L-idonate 5-dehydrogenase